MLHGEMVESFGYRRTFNPSADPVMYVSPGFMLILNLQKDFRLLRFEKSNVRDSSLLTLSKRSGLFCYGHELYFFRKKIIERRTESDVLTA